MKMGAALAVLAGLAAIIGAARWAVWRGFRIRRLPVTATPSDHGVEYRPVVIPTTGGKNLSGWLLPAAGAAPLVVVMHGWGANAETMLPLAVPLRRRGFSILLADARNHGASDADTFSSMPRFAEDIQAAMAWAERELRVPVPRMALLGHSVGGAAALLVASRHPRLGAVVSLSAFDHPERVMRSYLARARIPYVPLGWLVCRYVERIIGHRFDDIAPAATVANYPGPVLIGHGAQDRVVLPAAAHAIHCNAGPACELAILDGAGHEGPARYDEVAALLADFLERAFQGCRATR